MGTEERPWSLKTGTISSAYAENGLPSRGNFDLAQGRRGNTVARARHPCSRALWL